MKTVVNDNGGSKGVADFPLFIDGSPVTSGVANTVTANVVHTASETEHAGYAPSAWGGHCASNGTITLALAENKTCTITNNDIALTLTVNKVLVPSNDSGLFNLQIDGVTAGMGANVGNGGTTGAVPVNAGVHTVGETAGAGTNLADYVTVIDGDCATSGTIALALAENKTCTVTNTLRSAQFVVNKNFIPDSSAEVTVSLTCTDGTVVNDDTSASEADPANFTVKGFAPGTTCTATETVPPGYTADQSDCLNVDLVADGACTITNTLRSAQFAVNKDFIPDSGAGVTVSLNCSSGTVVTTPLPASETAAAVFSVEGFLEGVTCTATEVVPAGYIPDQSDCLNVDLVQDGVCTITNTLRSAEFVVNKDFIPDSGASVSVSLTCSDDTVVTTPLQASEGSPAVFTVTGYTGSPTCTVTETVPLGWTPDESDCLKVDLVSDGVCTIVNSFVPPSPTPTPTSTPTPTPTPSPTPVTPVVLPTVVPPTPTVAPPTPTVAPPTPTVAPPTPTVAAPTPTVAPPTPTAPPVVPVTLPPSGGSGLTPSATAWPTLAFLAGAMVLMLAGMGSAVWALRRPNR